jgi:hypothetical protein
MGTAMQLSEEKRQNRNAIIAAFEKHGIDYQLFNDELQANIKTPKGIVCVFLTNNKYFVNGKGKTAIEFNSPSQLIKILVGGFGLRENLHLLSPPPATNQNDGRCPHCNALISIIDTINHIANYGLVFTHKCRQCSEPYQVKAKINLTTNASGLNNF